MEDFQACFVRIKQPNVFFFQTIQDLTMNQLCLLKNAESNTLLHHTDLRNRTNITANFTSRTSKDSLSSHL